MLYVIGWMIKQQQQQRVIRNKADTGRGSFSMLAALRIALSNNKHTKKKHF